MMGDRAKEDIGLAQEVLLKHPLSISTDVRLVSTCQLLCIQCKRHFAGVVEQVAYAPCRPNSSATRI
jgi:hypothetical protein